MKNLNDYESLDDYLYDVERRPSNLYLAVFVGLQALFVGVFGAAIGFALMKCFGIEGVFGLIGFSALGAAPFVIWFLRYMRRRGVRVKGEYVGAGGNPAGTSDLLFGQVIGEIMPDGRWKWPEPTTSPE